MIKFIDKAFRMKPHLTGDVQTFHSQSYIPVSLTANDISTHENHATSLIKNNNQSTLHLDQIKESNPSSTLPNFKSEPSTINGCDDQQKKIVEDLCVIGNGLDLSHPGPNNEQGTEVNEKIDLKPEDFELLEKLREANRLIEADSKSLSFSSDGCSKSIPAASCNQKSSSHKKSSSTSSSTSSSSSACHKKSSSVSSVIGTLLSRQNSISSEQSDCSHKIGIPCSCPMSHSPDIMEEADKEPVCDSWSTWREIADNWEQHKDRHTFLKEMVRKGIPSHFRGLIWPLLCGAWNSEEKSNYKNYLRKSSKFEKFIRRDVSRTYPNHDMYRELDGPGQESLFNVIKAYSLLDPEVGYCQGSAFVAGLLLMQMPEEDAFAVFVQVMQKYGLRELYKPSMAKIELCIYQLECMIQDKNPSLYQHFQAHGMFASTFATPWFLSLFATSLPLSLSCRVLDIFLLEGMDCIMALSYAMLDISCHELKMRDMEEMIKLLGKELPHKLEEDPDHLFNASFKVKFCQKKMKKLEKDYNVMKTKENEDNIERKRLKTENKLLRQRIERLEEETSALADRLVQDQVKYANQEEELYILRRKHSLSLQSDATTTTSNKDATDGVPKVVASAKELQIRIDELVNREVAYLAEMHDLKMRIVELEKKNLESHGSDVADLQQQLVLSKLREAEMDTSAKEFEQRVLELDKYWQKHQELINLGDNKPKVQKAKVQLLMEELLSLKLKEANMSKELMELKLKVVDLETKNHVNERLIKKLEEEKEVLRNSLSELESKKISSEDQLRILKRQLSSAESKQQNDELMTKIKDAETSQTVAELKQKIAQLEIQNQELVTAEKLYKGLTQSDNSVDIDAKIEELHQQIVQLKELKRSFCSGKQQIGSTMSDASARNYGGESDSDFDEFDALRYKLKGSTSSLLRADKDTGSDFGKWISPPETLDHVGWSPGSPGSGSISLEGLVHGGSSDSDCFKEDVLAGGSDGVHHNECKTNPDLVLDSVFDDLGSLDVSLDFDPPVRSSPHPVRNSCRSSSSSSSSVKRPEFHNLPMKNPNLNVSCLEDPDKTPTNEILIDSSVSSRFAFNRESKPPGLDFPAKAFTRIPDILSDGNARNEISRSTFSSLIAGLDLPEDELKLNDVKINQDKNLSQSLDILSMNV